MTEKEDAFEASFKGLGTKGTNWLSNAMTAAETRKQHSV